MQSQQRDDPLFSREPESVIGNMSGSADEQRTGSAYQLDTARAVTPFASLHVADRRVKGQLLA